MVIGLNPITVAEAGPIMAKIVDLSWADDRIRVVEYLNRFRALVYTDYDKFKLFDNAFHCICVSTFDTGCDNSYQGFTLPNDVLGAEAVYSYGVPLTLRSRWREAHTGLGVNPQGRIEAVEVAELFPTERDTRGITRLKVFADNDNDAGKRVYMDIINASDKVQRICFTLIGNGFAVSKARVKRIISVTLPSVREGSVTVAQSDNYVLSIYDPWETVPVYKRYKVSGYNCPSTVLVQGTKRYRPIYFDHDIVEVGNQLIIEAAGQFFKFSNGTKDQSELKTAEYHLGKMKEYLAGEIARNRGNAIQDTSPFKGRRSMKNKTLPGYQR